MTELQINNRWVYQEKTIKNVLKKENTFKKKQYHLLICNLYSEIKFLIEHGEEKEVISKLEGDDLHILNILSYDPSINNNDFSQFFSVKYRLINIIIRHKKYSLFSHIATYYSEIIINTSVAHDLILSNDIEFFKILKELGSIGCNCLNQFSYCYPYNGYSFSKKNIKKIHKKLLKHLYFTDNCTYDIYTSNKNNIHFIEGIDVLYYSILHNSNDIIEIVHYLMEHITRDNYEIWNNEPIIPSQLYLKRISISIKTFELLNSSKYFPSVSTNDLKWTIRKHYLMFLKSYEIFMSSNISPSSHEYNMFTVFTILKRPICYFL